MSKISFLQVLFLFALFYYRSVIAITRKVTIEQATELPDGSDAYVIVSAQDGFSYIEKGRTTATEQQFTGSWFWDEDITIDSNQIKLQVKDEEDNSLGMCFASILDPPFIDGYCPDAGWLATAPFDKSLLGSSTGATLSGTVYSGLCYAPRIFVQTASYGTYQRSDDAGSTWTHVASVLPSTTRTYIYIAGATTDTRIRFICQDFAGEGGFIGSGFSWKEGSGWTIIPTSNPLDRYWSIENVDKNDMIYSSKVSGPWPTTGVIASDAYWAWSPETLNLITFTLTFVNFDMDGSWAYIYVQCAGAGRYLQSGNGGGTWTTVATSTGGGQTRRISLRPYAGSRVHFQCQHTAATDVGGFIATMTYRSVSYSTTNPITDGLFLPNYLADTGLVYTAQGDDVEVPISNTDAYWVWNAGSYNAITFIFSFNGISFATIAAKQVPSFIDYNNNDFEFQELNDKIIENTNYIYYLGLLVVASFSLIVICLSVSNCKQCLCKKKGKYSKIQQFDQSSVSDNV